MAATASVAVAPGPDAPRGRRQPVRPEAGQEDGQRRGARARVKHGDRGQEEDPAPAREQGGDAEGRAGPAPVGHVRPPDGGGQGQAHQDQRGGAGEERDGGHADRGGRQHGGDMADPVPVRVLARPGLEPPQDGRRRQPQGRQGQQQRGRGHRERPPGDPGQAGAGPQGQGGAAPATASAGECQEEAEGRAGEDEIGHLLVGGERGQRRQTGCEGISHREAHADGDAGGAREAGHGPADEERRQDRARQVGMDQIS